MNKRLFALLSVLVLASLMFTACGSPAPTASETVTLSRVEYDALMKKVDNLEKQVADLQSTATAVPTKAAATFTPMVTRTPVPTMGTVWYSNTPTPSMTPTAPAGWTAWKFDKGALTCEKRQEGIVLSVSGNGITDVYCVDSNRASFAIRVGKDEFTFMVARDKSGSTTVIFGKNHPEICVFSQKNHADWTFDSKKIEKSVLDANDPIKVTDASNATIRMRCVADDFDVSVEAYIKK